MEAFEVLWLEDGLLRCCVSSLLQGLLSPMSGPEPRGRDRIRCLLSLPGPLAPGRGHPGDVGRKCLLEPVPLLALFVVLHGPSQTTCSLGVSLAELLGAQVGVWGRYS